MVTSKFENGIVWLIVDGDLVAQEVLDEAEKWLPKIDTCLGFITDIRKMENAPIIEQKKLEAGRKVHNTGKPSAILIKDNAMASIVKIYIRFTKAEDSGYFTDIDKAIAWIRNYQQ